MLLEGGDWKLRLGLTSVPVAAGLVSAATLELHVPASRCA
jgi:hypothetical protein